MKNDIVITMPHNNSWKIILLIIILAAVLRSWGTFDLNEKIEDEGAHVSDAKSIVNYGITENWGWHHPQLSGLIMYSTMQSFGDNPVGWRIGNIFFGTASVLMVFMIGKLLYPGSAVPLIAASLLAFDPHHIYLSRTTFVEIPVTFFFLFYLYLLLEYTENKRQTLLFAGIALGLTIATKAYFFFTIPVSIAYALHRTHQKRGLTASVLIDFTVALLLLPFAIYFLSFFNWFSRGYTLPDFIQMKIDAVWSLKKLDRSNFAEHIAYLEAGGKPWEWFMKPIFWGHQRLLNSNEGRLLLQCNNPPFSLLVLPSLCATSIYALKKHLPRELLPTLFFCSCYLLIAMANRPMFSYSSAVLLPFAYLGVAKAITLFAIKINKEKLVYAGFLSVIIIWCAYMFPIISARMVSLAPFNPILSLVSFMGDF